jgi:hypothetical protein
MLPVGSQGDKGLKIIDLKESLDVNLNKIGEKFLYHYSIEDAFKNATNNLIVMAESQQFLQYSLRKRLTNE